MPSRRAVKRAGVSRMVTLGLCWGLLLALVSGAGGRQAKGQGAESRPAGELGIEGVDLDGKKVQPLKAGAGKAVVFIFVRTDCPISNRYAPLVQQMQAEYAGRAAFWLVYPDNDEPVEKIREHLRDYRYSLPALRDPGHALVRASGAETTPEAAVFGTRGELAYHGRIDNLYERIGRARSAATTHELSDALRDVVAGKVPQVSSAKAVGCSIMDVR